MQIGLQMLERFVEGLGRLRRWYCSHRTHIIFRLLRGAFQLGILTVSIWFIWNTMSAGYATISADHISLDPRRLILSWLCTAASTALGAWEWVLLANAFGGRLDIVRGVRIHLVSNLVKYVPGFIWPHIGKTFLAARQGVPAHVAALSVVCEFVIVFLDGGLLLALCLPYSGILPWSAGLRLALQVGAVLLAGASIVGLLFADQWLVRRLERTNVSSSRKAPAGLSNPAECSGFDNLPRASRDPLDLGQGALRQVNWNQLTFVVAAVLLTWCLLGLGFYILSAPAALPTWSDWSRHTFALASALLIGQVAIFAPMGIGVREAVLIALLHSRSSSAPILVLALVFRIEMMIGEVFCASVAWLVDKTRVASQNNPKG